MSSSSLKVLVTRKIPHEGTDLLSSKFTVDLWDHDERIPEDELLKRIVGVDALLCLITDKIDARVLDAAGPSLKIVSTMSVGVDHIDLKECDKRGIKVGHTPRVSADTIAEFTVGLLIATSRRIVEATAQARSGGWTTWKPLWMCGPSLEDSTVGIVGLGRIGLKVLDRLRPFKPKQFLYFDLKRRSALDEKRLRVKFESFPDLLKASDFVICMCALTEESLHLFDEKAYGMMKHTAVFINTARGGVIDQDSLYNALVGGQIFAAGIDVTTPEPLPTDHPLFKLDNCVITPHIASASLKAKTAMSMLAAENVICCLEGKDMPARFAD